MDRSAPAFRASRDARSTTVFRNAKWTRERGCIQDFVDRDCHSELMPAMLQLRFESRSEIALFGYNVVQFMIPLI